MCGIAGIFHGNGQPVELPVLSSMAAALAHRGPDGQGARLLAAEGIHLGLGHTRLKVIDLSPAADQPMANEDGSVWLVFNGEIYNYRELRAQLISEGCRFRTSSDTEVILRLYEQVGERCLERLDGMFALAVWDRRARRLLLARDRVGKKPLFYWTGPTRVAFASEIKALLRYPAVTPEVDTDVLPAFFQCGYAPTPATFYRSIHALPPGHLLSVDEHGRTTERPYWNLSVPPLAAPSRDSFADAAARVRELLTAAVRRRLIADVPLGAFLSGGLDSSIIVGLMSQLTTQPVRTFSIGFAGDAYFDETRYARLVAQRFKTTHTEFIVEPASFDLIDRLVWHHDGPFADSSALPTYVLSRLTRAHVTVALTGDGGDEVFAGYLRFSAALLAERIPAWVRRLAVQLLTGLPAWGGHRHPFRRLQKFASSAALPFDERFNRWIAVFAEDLQELMPGASAVAAIGAMAPGEGAVARAGGSLLSRLLYRNLKTYLLDDLLVKMDRCTMAHALEARSPFLDTALMEYVFRLPDAMKLRGWRTKVILRSAFADLLPREILTRGKMGFGVPLRSWFCGDMRQYLQDMLLAPDARLRRYVDQAYVGRLCAAHLSGRADYSHRLWTLLTFEVWLRQLPTWGRTSAAYAGQDVVPHHG